MKSFGLCKELIMGFVRVNEFVQLFKKASTMGAERFPKWYSSKLFALSCPEAFFTSLTKATKISGFFCEDSHI